MKSTKFLCLALIMCQNVHNARLTHVSDVSQKMFGKAAEKNSKLKTQNLSLTTLKLKKCVKKLLEIVACTYS